MAKTARALFGSATSCARFTRFVPPVAPQAGRARCCSAIFVAPKRLNRSPKTAVLSDEDNSCWVISIVLALIWAPVCMRVYTLNR